MLKHLMMANAPNLKSLLIRKRPANSPSELQH